VTVLGRALRLRCPRCGRAPLYRSWFVMDDPCPACGLRYEREHGYFVGAIYLNYAATIAVALGTVLGLDAAVGLPLRWQLAVGVALGALVPLVFFRYARGLWLAIDFVLSRADSRRARRPRPS
jgi:uncharacterized protein (DUF983 family)